MDIVDRIFGSLNRWSSAPAFVELAPGKGTVRLSAREFIERCDTLDRYFRAAGIGRRTTVALFLENSIDFVAVFVTLMRMRALISAVKLEFRTFELDEIFRNFDPDFVVADESHRPVISSYLSDRTFLLRRPDGTFDPKVRGRDPAPAAVPDSVASVNYTYRGLGYPLGAMIPYDAYQAGADFILGCLDAPPRSRSLVILPMPHIYTLVGSIFVPIVGGMTSVIVRTLHPRHLLHYIRDERINYMTSVPEIYLLLSRFLVDENRPADLRSLVSGGSRLTAEQFEAVTAAFGCEVLHGYGLTEYSIVTAPATRTSRPGTIGAPAPEISCRFAPDGELLIRSDCLTAGYYLREEETNGALVDGWFATGDFVREDAGHLVFVREKKRTCKVNGNMVDLAEVEKAALTFTGVRSVRAYSMNGSVGAEVQFDAPPTDGERAKSLRNHLFGIISSHKVPKTIVYT